MELSFKHQYEGRRTIVSAEYLILNDVITSGNLDLGTVEKQIADSLRTLAEFLADLPDFQADAKSADRNGSATNNFHCH